MMDAPPRWALVVLAWFCCGQGQGAGPSLVRPVRTVGAGGRRWLVQVQVCVLGGGERSVVLVHVGTLVTQPLVAQRAEALCQPGHGAI